MRIVGSHSGNGMTIIEDLVAGDAVISNFANINQTGGTLADKFVVDMRKISAGDNRMHTW